MSWWLCPPRVVHGASLILSCFVSFERDLALTLLDDRLTLRPPILSTLMVADRRDEPPQSYPERVKMFPEASVRKTLAERTRVDIPSVTRNNVNQLRRQNATLLPVSYSDKVYEHALADDTRELCKIGLFNDIPVADICCRLEDGKDVAHAKVYIMILGVLPTYRRLGVASALLQHVIDTATPGKQFAGRRIESIYLHVQTGNDAARAFYENFGFQVRDTVANYYQDLIPSSAWVLEMCA